jgi:hypothetical protein
LDFSFFHDIILDTNINLKYTEKFKNCKREYSNLIKVFISKSDNSLSFLIELFRNISKENSSLNYRKYQFIQFFYLFYDQFFIKVDDNMKFSTILFFINLYEKLTIDNKKAIIDQREINIIISICMLILINFPINDDFYLNGIKNRKGIQFYMKQIEKNKEENDTISANIINNNENNDNIYEKYLDYDSYDSLMIKFYEYQNFDDSIFKTLLLINLENINEVTISQENKLNFISKDEDYEKEDYKSFLKISYYNKEIKDTIVNIINLLNNKQSLGFISYKAILGLIINTVKNYKEDKCTFKHLVSSRVLCSTFFKIAFQKFYNIEEKNELITEKFLSICEICYISHSDPFFYDLIYDLIIDENSKKIGINLLKKLLIQFTSKPEKVKKYYINKINIINLIYKLIKKIQLVDESNKDFLGLKENQHNEIFKSLFEDDLLKTRFNCLKNKNGKKKTYIELMYKILTNLSYQSKNHSYIILLYEILILNIKKYKNKNENTQSVIYYFDREYYKGELKNNIIFNFFSKKETCDIPSLSVFFIYQTIKSYFKIKDQILKSIIDSLMNSFISDSKLLFNQFKESTKKTKNNILYNVLRDKILEIYKEKKHTMDIFLDAYKSKKNELNNNKNNINLNINNNNNELNDSFNSCKSSKSEKQKCQINKKKKIYVGKIKKNETNVNNEEETNTKIPVINKIKINDYYQKLSKKRLFTTQSLCENIESYSQFVLFPKLNLIQQVFGIYFIDKLFYDETFVTMKKYFNYYFKNINNNNHIQNPNIDNFLNYPTMIRNYTPYNFFYKDLFLRYDLDFFSHEYFKIIHPYFTKYLKKEKKRIFVKKCKNKEILNYLLDKNEKGNRQFFCDLITNVNVIFGEIIINNNIIYFHNKDKENFLQSLTDEEKEKYLFCAQDEDYHPQEKQLFIIKNEIKEIINRRYLFLFQACEIFLKNGKSYFFNLFSESNKIEFFKLFDDSIKIIDLKEDFRKKNYTESWLENKISTLTYLLQINKYSSRSYNDTNQYPVFPLLKLSKNRLRKLKYALPAQTKIQRQALLSAFEISMGKYHAHYNIHYSNSAFVLYFLIRMNPFTYNQVNLQGNKLDVPNRQFNSFKEFITIYDTTKEARELIPEFFLSTEFFYNYNCNFYGFRTNDGLMIHNLGVINNLSPVEFICENLELLNSKKIQSKIHLFIDNIFGVGQIGTKNDYNTFGKYGYKEFINLKSKLDSFKKNPEYNYKTIKDKISRKIIKIINLGQTPFKLIEEKHVKYEPNKEINSNKKQEKTDVIPCDVNDQIISIVKFPENRMIYILTYKDGYQIKILSPSLSTEFIIPIPYKIKLLTKLKLFGSDFLYGFKYNSKFIFIAFNLTLILCRFADNSFIFLTLINHKPEYRVFITESFITVIIKSSNNSFITGHGNGKIMEWNFTGRSINNPNFLSEEVIELKRTLIAHNNRINGIYLDNNLGIIITTCIDYTIYIRKYYDFTLLSVIKVPNKICIQLLNYYAFIYILFYNVDTDDYVIQIYSLNGIELQKGNNDYINNIEIDKEGNLYVGYYDQKKIIIFDSSLKKIKKEINFEDKFKEKKNLENLKFMNFVYDDLHKCLYCTFSNGTLIKNFIIEEEIIENDKDNDEDDD